jgi:hypothetical protein
VKSRGVGVVIVVSFVKPIPYSPLAPLVVATLTLLKGPLYSDLPYLFTLVVSGFNIN